MLVVIAVSGSIYIVSASWNVIGGGWRVTQRMSWVTRSTAVGTKTGNISQRIVTRRLPR